MCKNKNYNVTNQLSDYELVVMAQEGLDIAREYLILRYENLIKSKMYKYFIVGGDEEDLLQEAAIGFNNAIDRYDKTKSSFSHFANICIERNIISRITAANRMKHRVLSKAISIDMPIDPNEEGKALLDVLYVSEAGGQIYENDPGEIYDINETCRLLEEKSKEVLSDYEYRVWKGRCSGLSYEELGKLLNVSTKSIDNAVQRITAKLKKIYDK